MISNFTIAKEKILDDLEGIIMDLFRASPKHRRRGLWNIATPWRANSKPSQMCVWLQGGRRGAWKDFHSGEGIKGNGGDAIDLVAYGLEGSVNPDSRKRAVAWVFDRYGLGRMDDASRQRIQAEASTRRIAMEARDTRQRDANRTRARKLFYSASDALAGTAVATYLAGRGIDLAAVPHLTRSFRFLPAAEYWMDAPQGADGKRTGKGSLWPALVSAMVDGEGRLCANHLTFLARDGSAKAPVEKAKLMWPETAGLVIRVTDGPSGLTASEAAAQGVAGLVGVTEGIEDALSAAVGNDRLRMWAAGSLSGLLTLPDHACVSGWLIFKDNDWGKRQAEALFKRAVARLRGFGKPVEVVSVPAEWGKDANDALQSR